MLALSYANHRLRPREILFASFISFSFSNNLGFALMSGGSVRYWIYRLIYFVLPLALAILLVAIYDMRPSSRGSDE